MTTQTQELKQVVDDLLAALLAVSPEHADLPVVKQARDLVWRLPMSCESSVLDVFAMSAADDVPTVIKGSD